MIPLTSMKDIAKRLSKKIAFSRRYSRSYFIQRGPRRGKVCDELVLIILRAGVREIVQALLNEERVLLNRVGTLRVFWSKKTGRYSVSEHRIFPVRKRMRNIRFKQTMWMKKELNKEGNK